MEFIQRLRGRMMMNEGVSKNQVLLAGGTVAAMAVAVVGHMYVLDWFGKKLRGLTARSE